MPDEFMPHGEALDLRSAASLLTAAPAPETPAAPAAAETPTPAPAAEETPAPAADEAPAAETPAAEAAEETPAQGDAPAAKDGKDEQGSLPPIEPPSSWKTEEKEFFKSLPRQAQETIQRREQDRDAELRRLQNTAADQRKAADGEVARLKGLADNLEKISNDAVDGIAKEFPEIKSQADIDNLARTDPGRFAEFQAALMRYNAIEQQKKAAQDEIKARNAAAQKEVVKAHYNEILKHFPTWSDPKVLAKEHGEVVDYAVKLGADPAAARATTDPFIIRIAHKAMLYDRAQAAAKAAVSRDAAPTLKPGAVSVTPKADAAANTRKAQIAKLDKSGDIEDAIALMLQPASRR